MLSDWMGLRQATQVPSDCCGPRVSVDHCRCVPGASECRGVSSSKRVARSNKGGKVEGDALVSPRMRDSSVLTSAPLPRPPIRYLQREGVRVRVALREDEGGG
jgi:hypothetical protein